MKILVQYSRYICAALGGILGSFLGEIDGFIYTLIAFAAIDYISGVMCAIVERNLSSQIGFKGICRKVLIFSMVGVGHLLDVNILGGGDVLRAAIIGFYLANEGISLIENAARLGLPVPEKFTDILSQLKEGKN